MAVNLRGCNLVSINDLSAEEIWQILDTADAMKLELLRGQAHPVLAGKTLGMIFQKPSLRTRVSFEVGMTQLGGHAIYLAPSDISLGKRETTEDIALVLSRYCDILMARVFGHDIVVDLAAHASVPVINGLSDREHPCQILADLMTINEKKGCVMGLNAVYSGDGNNVAHSLMYGAAILGMNLTVVTPPGYEPDETILAESRQIAEATACTIAVSNELMESCEGADVIYTDVWASMGQEAEAEERARLFAPYQVNEKLLEVADDQCIILHCLPAHYGEEIDYAVSRTPNSMIFDQAENRMHAQKALMALIGS
jgi:ornithine carbamoyltransferase